MSDHIEDADVIVGFRGGKDVGRVYRNRIKELKAELNKIRWTLVKEQMPTDKGYILRYSTKTGVLSATYYANTNWEAGQLKAFYTHWKSETLPKEAKS